MANREKLLTHAIPLMLRHGYSNISMDAIISASGVAKSNAYYHFPTKELLGHEVLQQLIASFKTLYQITLENNTASFSEKSEHYLGRIILFQHSVSYAGDPVTVLCTEINSSYSYELFNQYKLASITTYEHWLTGGIAGGFCNKNLNIASATNLLFNSLEGAYTQTRVQKSTDPLHKTFKSLFASFTK